MITSTTSIVNTKWVKIECNTRSKSQLQKLISSRWHRLLQTHQRYWNYDRNQLIPNRSSSAYRARCTSKTSHRERTDLNSSSINLSSVIGGVPPSEWVTYVLALMQSLSGSSTGSKIFSELRYTSRRRIKALQTTCRHQSNQEVPTSQVSASSTADRNQQSIKYTI